MTTINRPRHAPINQPGLHRFHTHLHPQSLSPTFTVSSPPVPSPHLLTFIFIPNCVPQTPPRLFSSPPAATREPSPLAASFTQLHLSLLHAPCSLSHHRWTSSSALPPALSSGRALPVTGLPSMTTKNEAAKAATSQRAVNANTNAIPSSEHMGPIIVSANRFNDIKPYMDINYRENPAKWSAVFPWEFPQHATREQEEAFLIHEFGQVECRVQGFQFLKQGWYGIAINNYEHRVPLVARDWRQKNLSYYDLEKTAVLEAMCKDNAEPIAFFPEEMDMYGEKFLRVVMQVLQAEARVLLATAQSPSPSQADGEVQQQTIEACHSQDAELGADSDIASLEAADTQADLSIPAILKQGILRTEAFKPLELPAPAPLKQDTSGMPSSEQPEVSANTAGPYTAAGAAPMNQLASASQLLTQQSSAGDSFQPQGEREYVPRHDRVGGNSGSRQYNNVSSDRQYRNQVVPPWNRSTQQVPVYGSISSQVFVPSGRVGSEVQMGLLSPQYGIQRSTQHEAHSGHAGVYIPQSLHQNPQAFGVSYPQGQQNIQQMSRFDPGQMPQQGMLPGIPMHLAQQWKVPSHDQSNYQSYGSRNFSSGSVSQYSETFAGKKVRQSGQSKPTRGNKSRGASGGELGGRGRGRGRGVHGSSESYHFGPSDGISEAYGQVFNYNQMEGNVGTSGSIADPQGRLGNVHTYDDWRGKVGRPQNENMSPNGLPLGSLSLDLRPGTDFWPGDAQPQLPSLGHHKAERVPHEARPFASKASRTTAGPYAGPFDTEGRVVPEHLLNGRVVHPAITHVTKVVVTGMPAVISPSVLKEELTRLGAVHDLYMVPARSSTHLPPPIFVTFEDSDGVRAALAHNGKPLCGHYSFKVQTMKEYWVPDWPSYPSDEFRAMPLAYRESWIPSKMSVGPVFSDVTKHTLNRDSSTTTSGLHGDDRGIQPSHRAPGSAASTVSNQRTPTKIMSAKQRRKLESLEKQKDKNLRTSTATMIPPTFRDQPAEEVGYDEIPRDISINDKNGADAIQLSRPPDDVTPTYGAREVEPDGDSMHHSDPKTNATFRSGAYAINADDHEALQTFRYPTKTPTEKKGQAAMGQRASEMRDSKRSEPQTTEYSSGGQSFHTAAQFSDNTDNGFSRSSLVNKSQVAQPAFTGGLRPRIEKLSSAGKGEYESGHTGKDFFASDISSTPPGSATSSHDIAEKRDLVSLTIVSSIASIGSTVTQGQSPISVKSDGKQRVVSDTSDVPNASFVTAPNTPAIPHQVETAPRADVVKVGKTTTRMKSPQTEKAKGPAQTESLSMFGKKSKPKGKKTKAKIQVFSKEKPTLPGNDGYLTTGGSELQDSDQLFLSSVSIVNLPKSGPQAIDSNGANPTTKPAMPANAVSAVHVGLMDNEANINHNATHSDHLARGRATSFVDHVKTYIMNSGQRSRSASPVQPPHDSPSLQTTDQNHDPVFGSKESACEGLIIEQATGTARLAERGAALAVPVAKLMEYEVISDATASSLSGSGGDNVGLGISTVDPAAPGSKPKKKKKKPHKKNKSPVLKIEDDETEDEANGDDFGVSNHHPFPPSATPLRTCRISPTHS